MRIFFTTIFSCIILALSAQTSYNFYIAPDGSDTNDGLSSSNPFATLEKARDEAQAITGNYEITIWLLDGDYYLDQTFQLNAADSGSATKSITYRAQNKHQAKLHLNRDIPVTDFQDITDPALINRMRPEAVGHIKTLDLSTMNLTNINTWPDYFPSDNQELLRIYAGGEQMQLSQFPNDTMMTMKVVTQNEPGIFEYRGTRHHNWLEAVNDGLWFQGYWRVAWQFDAVKTMSIDTTNRLVYQTTSVPLGIGSKYHRPEGNGAEPYKAINLLEEIDLPGEWCIHFSTQKLYIWIPDNVNDIQLLDLKQPIIRVTDVSNTTFRDLDISYSAGQGIVVENGDGNLIVGCDIYNVIDDAVQIVDGTNHTVQSNDLHHLGAGGIFLSGGNRQTLTPANHSAINNHIYEFGQVKVIYAGAVIIPGKYDDNNVGMYVAHNEIHGAPHVGIWYGGNNHLFEYNNIYDICRISNDMAAFYSWNDWTSYGNVIRYNYIHDAEQAHGAYFDDGDSGEEVYDNIMSNIDVAVFVGGGHDNTITGNIAVNCHKTVHVDNRGVSRGYNLENSGMVNRVLSVDYQNAPWSIQYPSIVNILDPSYSQELPVGNVVDCNVALNTPLVVDFTSQNATDWEMTLGTNYTDTDASISDPTITDLAAILAATGYDGENCQGTVNWDNVGLIEDEYRNFGTTADCGLDTDVEANDFNVMGDATAQTGTCFELTPDLYNKTGAIWHGQQVNLDYDFELNFDVNFGVRGAGGGDGMAFVLSPLDNTSELVALGNVATGAYTLDGWQSNMIVNESDTYTNTSGSPQLVDISSFSFHAGRLADPVTPFVVKVNGDNDFTVLKIGTTRTSADYIEGFNTFSFKDGGANYVINNGETIAIGFLDASADGSDSGLGSVITKDHDDTPSADEIWYSGNNLTVSGSVVEGQAPIEGNTTIFTLTRNYYFDIGFLITDTNAGTEIGTSNITTEFGNISTSGSSVDGWASNMVINETDIYTNTSGYTQTVDFNSFSFKAGQEADPITPFIVKVNGDNDFTILKVGTTRTSADYNIGLNTFEFKEGGSSYVLNDGETIAIGFLDANADGSGSGQGSVVVNDNAGDTSSFDEIWYSGHSGTLSGSVTEEQAPTSGAGTVTTLRRDYHFSIGMSIGTPDPQASIFESVTLGAGGLGYSGLNPSVNIEFDTYKDATTLDPTNDHISFQKNGNPNHNGSGYLDINVKKNPTVNMEDGNFHNVSITWNAANKELTYIYDGSETGTVIQDITNTIFGGNPNVFFGWTGSTTSKRNQQQVCVNSVSFKESIMTNAMVSNITCDDLGSINLNTTGGTAPYTYTWSDGSTSKNLSSITTIGNHSVTISDNCDVEVIENFYITDECACAITADLSYVSCDDNDDSVTLLVSAIAANGGASNMYGTYDEEGNLLGFAPYGDGGTIVVPYAPSISLTFVDLDDPSCTSVASIDVDPCNIVCTYEKVKNNTFEGGWGAWNDGGTNCERILSSGIGTDGNWSVRLRNGTSTSVVTSNTFNMSAYSEAKVEFKYQCRSMDSTSEGFQLEVSTDGGANFNLVEDWYRDTDFTNTTNYTEEVIVPGPFTSTTQFRFRCMANGNYDHVYLDRINISACEGAANQSRIVAKEEDIVSTELSIVNLFPNPAKENVNIICVSNVEGEVELSMYNATGQIVLSRTVKVQEGKNTFQLDIDRLKGGMYMIEINDGNKKATKRLAIIK